MSRRKKQLAIVSMLLQTSELMAESIRKVIGREVDVYSYAVEGGKIVPHSVDLVVSSGYYNCEHAKNFFPGTQVINGYRIVSGKNFEQLFRIPRGQRALLVANPEEASEEVIQQLKKMGIDHLVYEPYWNNKKINPKNYDLIITPHMQSYCPSGISKIIDIGPRVLSYKTFAEIIDILGLDINYLNIFEMQYLRPHIDGGRNMYRYLSTSENLRIYQEAILRDIDEGIIALDERNNVVLTNRVIYEIFGSSQISLNSGLQLVMKQFSDEIRTINGQDTEKEPDAILFRYKGKSFHCSKSYIQIDNTQHCLYTFKSIDQIQNLATNVQRKLHSKSFSAKYTFENIWGRSEAIQKAKNLAKRFAITNQTILLTGESGTGKELFAQAIHNASPWANKPFVAVNLASIPHSIMESELFGYVEGAFTDAKKGGKRGVFEIANGGTIFLDEIGDAPTYIQLLLLRVLEEREVIRVGAEQPTPINVRVIAATNKDLAAMVQDGTFRNDLFFRLNVLPVQTVPLRAMRDEILEFIDTYLIERFGQTKMFEPCVLSTLRYYEWPGNFRELRNVLEYLFYSAGDREMVTADDIPNYIIDGISSTKLLETMLESDPLMCSILDLLAQCPDYSMGRGKLMSQLDNEDCIITEGNVKRALINLKDAGLIHTGTTRQGSVITELGLYINKKLQSS
jgi:transcriptional regulator with PAS, ATPase and Fis domain